MDEIVQQAMRKWPNVPNCFGWLALDRRGQWRMRDEAAQRAGHLGDPIRHDGLVQFIARNYHSDADGRWFFQNGPQRVFVELEYTPWVVRFHAGRWTVMTGEALHPEACLMDEHGNLLFVGIIDGQRQASHIAVLSDSDLQTIEPHIVWSRDYDENDPAAPPGTLSVPGMTPLPILRTQSTTLADQFAFIASPQKDPPSTI